MDNMSLKSKLRNRELTFGSWISFGHPGVAEIMANSGFDWLVIDMEHSAITIREAEEIIRVIDLCGVTPLVRLSANDPVQVKRVMDAGAHGIIVPMVNTKNEAVRAVASVYYPPRGCRGVGLSRAQGYGKSFEDYRAWLSSEALVIVQIEHIQAVENLEAVLTVDGVDAFIVGPYDLSASLGSPGNFKDKRMLDAMNQITDIAEKISMPAGFHVVSPKPGLVKEKIEEGYTFIAYSADFLFLSEMCSKGHWEIRQFAHKSKSIT